MLAPCHCTVDELEGSVFRNLFKRSVSAVKTGEVVEGLLQQCTMASYNLWCLHFAYTYLGLTTVMGIWRP